MRTFILFLSLLFSTILCGQTILSPDTVIDMKYYKAYYNYSVKSSVYCVYKIYKAGGTISRANYKFTGSIPHYNYLHSGYDKGHLVPAEDFAYSKTALKYTFKYWNCVPQTPSLNRGKWKTYENHVRKLSKSDSLIVVAGASEFDKSGVPQYCWKVVYSLSSHQDVLKIVLDLSGKRKDPSEEFLKIVDCIIKESL